MSTTIDIAGIEKEIDAILEKARTTAAKIIDDAHRKAREILEKPLPIEELEREVKEIIEKAEREAKEIMDKARKEVEEIIEKSMKKLDKATWFLVEKTLGV